MTNHNQTLVRYGRAVPAPGGPAGPVRSLSRERPMVLLACASEDARYLERAWVGQALDTHTCPDLALALVRTGQLGPDMIIVGDCGAGPIGPSGFLRTVRRVDTAAVVVAIVPDDRSVADPGSLSGAEPTRASPPDAEYLAAGATSAMRRPLPAQGLLHLLRDSRRSDGSFQVRPLPVDLGRLRVDGTAARIWVDGQEELLPTMEFLLLRYLAERHGQIVPRDELARAAWGDSGAVPSNSLAVHVTRLRRRFPTMSGTGWIRSIRGSGYQLVVPSAVRFLPRRVGS